MALPDLLSRHLLATAPTQSADRLRARLWRHIPGTDPDPERGAPARTHLSDAALYQTFRAGDRSAFDALLTRHLPKLVGYASKHLGPEGEDAVQTALLDFIRKAPPLNRDEVAPLMFAFVRNAVREVYRKGARALPLEAPAETADALAELIRHQDMQRLVEAVALLDPLQQEVVERVFNGESNVAIAEAIKLTPSHIGVLKHRAHQLLKARLAQ